MEVILDDAVLKLHVISHIMNLNRNRNTFLQSNEIPEVLKKFFEDNINIWTNTEENLDHSMIKHLSKDLRRILNQISTEDRYVQRLLCFDNYSTEQFGDFLEFCQNFKILVDLWKGNINKASEEFIEEQNKLKELNYNIKINEDIIKELQKRLDNIKSMKKEKISRYDYILKELNERINYVNEIRKEEKSKIIQINIDLIREIQENHTIESQNLQKSIESAEHSYNETCKKLLMEEKLMIEEKQRKQFKFHRLILEYDEMMLAKEKECEDVRSEIRILKKQLKLLKFEMAPIKAQHDEIIYAKLLKEEEERIAKEKREKLLKAVCLIQSTWRGYKCRKFLKILKAKKNVRKAKMK